MNGYRLLEPDEKGSDMPSSEHIHAWSKVTGAWVVMLSAAPEDKQASYQTTLTREQWEQERIEYRRIVEADCNLYHPSFNETY